MPSCIRVAGFGRNVRKSETWIDGKLRPAVLKSVDADGWPVDDDWRPGRHDPLPRADQSSGDRARDHLRPSFRRMCRCGMTHSAVPPPPVRPSLTSRGCRRVRKLGEMRSTGLRNLLFYCGDYICAHSVIVNADRWAVDVRLSDLERLFVCPACGHRGADVRPFFDTRGPSRREGPEG